jgi:asparagine synthase (glutamine-hydrolysing)
VSWASDADYQQPDQWASIPARTAVSAPYRWSDSDVVVGIRGTPRILGPVSDSVNGENVACLVHRGYREQGDGVVRQLSGSFALAIVDAAKDRVLLAVDRMGIERLTYALCEDRLLFGTSAIAVARAARNTVAINLQSLFDYLFFHMIPAPTTALENVYKVPRASMVEFQQGALRVRSYWEPTFSGPAPRRQGALAELEAELHASLENAVRAAQPSERTGAFLSGGLDSSTVVGKLRKVTQRPVKVFSIGFGVTEYDELSYARIASSHFGCDAHEYVARAGDIVDFFPLIARAYDEPFGNSSALPTYLCARLARDSGIDHLLAGDGGDELFAGNERYARQMLFERYYSLPQVLRSRALEPLFGRLPSVLFVGPMRKAARYVEQARIPLPRRLETWNLLNVIGMSALLHPEFLSAVDQEAPLRLMESVYAAAPTASVIDKLLYYDWRFTLADNDLRKVETTCELAGVRVSYPMLHDDVVDISTRVPPNYKLRKTELRWFYKKAMADFLPAEIIDKRKHGFGLPFGLWLRESTPLQGLIYEALSNLQARRIVKPGVVDDIRRLSDGRDAGYYGVLLWVLGMLEQWLAEHELSV